MELTKDIVTDIDFITGIVLDSDIVIPTSSCRHRHSDINAVTDAVFCSRMARDPRRGRDKVQKNLRARRRPRRGRDKVQKSLRARRRPHRGRDKVQRNLRARRNLISTQFRPSPTQQNRTHHRPRRLIEETREDEAAISFIKPDDSVLLVRLKGKV